MSLTKITAVVTVMILSLAGRVQVMACDPCAGACTDDSCCLYSCGPCIDGACVSNCDPGKCEECECPPSCEDIREPVLQRHGL